MATSDNETDLVKISARIPKSLHKKLKQFCLDFEVKEMHVIRDAIENHIRNKGKKP